MAFAAETLLSIILPTDILEVFEVSKVTEEHTGIIEETGLERRIIHIHLDERDLRSKEWHDDTKVELFTRVKRVLPQGGEKWSESQKTRPRMVFEFAPKLKEAYSLVCRLRAIFKNKKLTKDTEDKTA